MGESGVCLRFDEDLRFFLAPRNRRPGVRVPWDGTSTIGHLVEALGVPLTEVGTLVAGGQPAAPSYRGCRSRRLGSSSTCTSAP
jgi:hypothetical protein